MAASAALTTLIDQLVELFNRRSMDLPDGYFTRQTQFLLNGVPFEEIVGRSADDPLTLMLTRGPAGYRFTAKALQHAVPDAALQRGELAETIDKQDRIVSGQYWLSGHLRGSNESVEMVVTVEVRFRGETIGQLKASLDPIDAAKLSEARLRA